MRTGFIDTYSLSSEEYWKIFGRLITSTDIGTVLGTTGWILLWLDHIPDHLFHTHFSIIVFLCSLLAGLHGARIMIKTRNRLGTKLDQRLHVLMIFYTIAASGAGILVNMIFPAH